jgi:hypothetical protein
MKNFRLILLAFTALALAALACGGGETATPTTQPTPAVAEATPTLMPTNTSEPEPEATPEATPEAGDASIEITNLSGVDVWYVFISPSDAEDWGDDWLGGDLINDGQTHTISNIPEGVYDLKAADENGEAIELLWGAEIVGDMTWDISGSVTLEVINNSEQTIFYLYITSATSDVWGEDWLGSDIIPPGEIYTVYDLPPDVYDIKVTDEEDTSIEAVYNVDIGSAREWTVYGVSPLPNNAVLRFEERFEDNRNNWGLDTEDENVYYRRPADGEYCILIKSDNFTAWEWYEPFRTDEFIAEVSCAISGAEDASCGLGFGPDGDNIYWYEISPYDQTFALFVLEDGSWQDSLVSWTTSRNINPSGVNYLSMQRVNSMVSLFVNGILVEEINSDLFPTGRVGLGGSTYSEGNATVCLDNLRVWRLE